MRFGGPVFGAGSDPDSWVPAVRREGYTAAFCPVGLDADEDLVRAYADAAKQADIVIAEVGAWSNPLSDNEEERRRALAHCQRSLALAELIGARCCVNVSGSRGTTWDGPDPRNLTEETFDLIVDSVRAIIDAVKPTRTFYTLETMPWMYPDSTESYVRLLAAVDRPHFAVHFDPANLICSPQRYYDSGTIIREFCRALGPHIRSCHAKDIALSTRFMTHLDEVRPGLGGLDYGMCLRELDALDPETPLMMEHLPSQEEYTQAAAYIRSVAAANGVRL